MARSAFYYQQTALQLVDKYAAVKDQIKAIYEHHKGRYGYWRITESLRRQGRLINHKTVQRLMDDLQLRSLVRIKKYRSYRGTIGQIAPNLVNRDFGAARPNEKWVTDVTEFKVDGNKLYLSPVLDLFNGEIVAYTTARRPLFKMIGTMLKKAFSRLKQNDRPILHSDQGWQYQMDKYRHLLKERAINQSMSRKGNCLDNATMKSFFGTLKSEYFHLTNSAAWTSWRPV